MVFLDETGKRWRAIKRSATASVLTIALPIAALVAGAYVFNPGWSALALKPAQKPQTVEVHTTKYGLLAIVTQNSSNKKISLSSTKSSTSTTQSATPSTQVAVTPTQSTSSTTTSSSPVTQPTSTDPGNSVTGRSHHFTTL